MVPSSEEQTRPSWPFLVLIVGCLGMSLLLGWIGDRVGAPLMRDQHVVTALDFAENGIDFFHPRILGFNATDTPTILEPPIWQALSALALRMGHGWLGMTNLVSFVVALSVLVTTHLWMRANGWKQWAWWTSTFLAAQPLFIRTAGEASCDGFAIATSIFFFMAVDRAIQSDRAWWWPVAALLAVVAALAKAPFFFAYGLGSALWLLASERRREWKKWLCLSAVGLLSLVAMMLWTRYADAQHSLAEFPLWDLRLKNNPKLQYWYFGDLAYRLDTMNWVKGGWRMLTCIFGSTALTGLCAAGLWRRGSRLPAALLIGCLGSTVVFTQVVLFHRHYYLMLCLPCAMLCALAASGLEKAFPTRSKAWAQWRVLLGGGMMFALAFGQGFIAMEIDYGGYGRRIGQEIAAHTDPNERVIIQGGGWGGEMLMWARRKGLSIEETNFLENPATVERLKALGYRKIVMISESQLTHGYRITNPGNSGAERNMWWFHAIPKILKWPTLVSTDDLFIAEIP